MATKGLEHVFNGDTTPYTAYDATKTTLGKWIVQNTGTTAEDVWAGPQPVVLAQITDTAIATGGVRPYVMQVTNDVDWIFLIDYASDIINKYFHLYEYSRSARTFKLKGSLDVRFPYSGATQGIYTGNAFCVSRHLYTTGTVSVSNSTVTGNGTTWQSARIASGCRIGFGSTDPNEISQWYEIGSISAEGTLTILGTTSQSAGTPYVIDELRIIMALSQSGSGSVATNAGLFVVKGLSYDTFGFRTLIPAAMTTDNIRACYWLSDADAITSVYHIGVFAPDPVSNTEHYAYLINRPTTTTLQIYAFNVRAALVFNTGTNGKAKNAYVFKTGVTNALAAAVTTHGINRIITCNHGIAAGDPSVFFAGAGRVYRIPIRLIQPDQMQFVTDGIVELPTGGSGATYQQLTVAFVDYDSTIDRFIFLSTAPYRHYIGKYEGLPLENIWNNSLIQMDRGPSQTTSPVPSNWNSSMSWTSNGIIYLCRYVSYMVMHAIPMVHWDYAAVSNQRLITPALSPTRVRRFRQLYVNRAVIVGGNRFGQPTDPYRVYARVSGIVDNSGTWTLLDETGDLSGFNINWERFQPAQIQFMFEFCTPAYMCVPARIHSLLLVYDQYANDDHFEPATHLCDAANNYYAWKFARSFGSTVPPLRVALLDENDVVMVEDTTSNSTGTFERSIDGGRTWTAWDDTDKGNEITYYRYRPSRMDANKRVRMVIMLA